MLYFTVSAQISQVSRANLGLSMVAALAGIVSVLSGPAAPIVIPIAGAFVFAAWAREVYAQS